MLEIERDFHNDDEIKQILLMKKVAVVGISRHDYKISHQVPKYLSNNGFDIIPVNPEVEEILGKKCYGSISDIPEHVDIIEIFRPSNQVLPFVQDAIKKKPKVIWLQEGIHNLEAEDLAKKSGIDIVFNRCMLAEHKRLF